MPGPPPSRNPRRTNARPDWVTLPAAGRPEPAPQWPLVYQSGDHLELWEQLWATPQATQWERLGHSRVVARYVVLVLQVEEPEASAALLGEVRQMEDRLGLSPMAMRRLQWEMAPAEEQSTGLAVVSELDEYRDAV